MIRSIMAACAQSVVRDAETNRVSVFNVLEEIAAPEFPAFLPELATVLFLERRPSDPNEVECEFAFVLNGEELWRGNLLVHFDGKLRSRAFLVARGVGPLEPGRLTVTWYVAGKKTGSWDILINKREQPAE